MLFSIYHSINLGFEAKVAEKFLNGIYVLTNQNQVIKAIFLQKLNVLQLIFACWNKCLHFFLDQKNDWIIVLILTLFSDLWDDRWPLWWAFVSSTIHFLSKVIYPTYYKNSNEAYTFLFLSRLGRQGSTGNFCNFASAK